ncbi:MAG: LysR family transcriptional regulator [Sphingomonas sp.]|uniref:LysR family transcriptional regulator n=1 Tax=Sphingomonas sp. TaxID=28214 RepID=UPI0017C65EC4|nr:LysR family transcriptional regulator [Sphingomonas sp.]MBA3668107.1 LysR family transcriptional regulator [Sphingomonas sp.]
MRNLPLNGLRVLAATLEAGGIRAAARLLGLSPSVVHRHMRELEARIGVSLVERGGGRLRFTPAGQRLGRIAAQTLGELAVGVEATREDRRPNEVVISTTESFAELWLLPRLAAFTEARGRFAVSIKTGQRLSRIPADADIAIRLTSYVDDSQPAAEPLMSDVMVPVLAPDLARSAGLLAEPRDILTLPLIHDRDPQVSWLRWCGALGIDSALARSGTRMTSSALVQSAAALGMGAGLARRRMAEASIAAGRLVELTKFAVPIGSAYWIVRRPVPRAAEQLVLDWLKREAAASAGPT